MMNLDQQLQLLITDASKHGVPSPVMEQGVTPVLEVFANQLQHLEYYVLQNLEQSWVITTLVRRDEPEKKKKVIYAFATLKDAATFQGTSDPRVIAMSVPVAHILFQLFAFEDLDSMVFFEEPHNLTDGREIYRADLQNSIQAQLKHLRDFFESRSSHLPPDIA